MLICHKLVSPIYVSILQTMDNETCVPRLRWGTARCRSDKEQVPRSRDRVVSSLSRPPRTVAPLPGGHTQTARIYHSVISCAVTFITR
jgi:hypothetical protein